MSAQFESKKVNVTARAVCNYRNYHGVSGSDAKAAVTRSVLLQNISNCEDLEDIKYMLKEVVLSM